VQVRDENSASADDGTEWWFASVRTETEWRRVAVPFARLRSLNPKTDGKLDLDKVRQPVFVIDLGHGRRTTQRMPPTMPTREAPRARTMSSAPLTEPSQEAHDGLVAHELAPRQQILNGRHQPALGVHGEGDLQTRGRAPRSPWRSL
jgi:hypothetical protein